MESSAKQFKDALSNAYVENLGKSSNKGGMMLDMLKYSGEMKEQEKLKGGKSDKKGLFDLAMKHAFGDKVLTTSKKIKSILKELKKQIDIGIKVEMEHTKDEKKAREIAMDHLMEDPKYYDKLKKIESKESSQAPAKREFAKDLQNDKDYLEFKKNAKFKDRYREYSFGVPNVTSDDPYINKRKYSRPGKEETSEATGSGSSGAFEGPLFGGDDKFLKKSQSETPNLKEGLATGAMGIDKVETKEATGSGSVGGYVTPAAWAKSTKKKDWGPSRKTQIPGGGFVKVKKKCTKFPYCNQGDINALKITKNESVKEAIRNVSKKIGISENIITTILENEIRKVQKRIR